MFSWSFSILFIDLIVSSNSFFCLLADVACLSLSDNGNCSSFEYIVNSSIFLESILINLTASFSGGRCLCGIATTTVSSFPL